MPASQFSAAAQQVLDLFAEVFPPDPQDATVEQLRAADDRFFGSQTPPDAVVEPVRAGGVPSLWVGVPGSAEDRAVILFHGGGYLMGSAYGWRGVAAEIARATGFRVLAVDYRLAPEHTFPAAQQDAVAAYEWVAAQLGPQAVVLAGASSGGNLVLTALHAIRAKGLPMPAAAVAASPWTDMTLTAATLESHADRDPLVSKAMLTRLRETYLGDHDPRDPLASPLYGPLDDLPPLLLIAGTDETVLDDTRNFAAAATHAGATVDVHLYQGVFHLWHNFPAIIPEGRAAITEIGAFIRKHARRRWLTWPAVP
ncbi:alpha/beta fold hydrolase [Amycolatopsis nigrescens]|uniref:alpha/beta fold hydrolase n=1 Tax=Amycolatopsis nigrescens TaxID=381445 RepID=UPI00035E1D7E|nr:alpha/beta hydrolase [Amycolatopsis nigrescens]